MAIVYKKSLSPTSKDNYSPGVVQFPFLIISQIDKMNIYTATAEEIGSLENIGAVSVDKKIELRKAAMAGSHDPITVKDLVKVRLPEDYWLNLIEHGELSLEMPEIAKPKTPVVTTRKTETASKADLQKMEKDFGRTLEKNLEVFWNRILTKIEKN